jgi:hypothetical protein
LANKDFDRRRGRGGRLHPDALRAINPQQNHLVRLQSDADTR